MTESQSIENTLSDSTFEIGQFWYYFDEDRWVWSDELARIHGYAGTSEVTPTTQLVLEHKHPDDKARVDELIQSIRNGHKSFSSLHRIVRVDGTVVPVAVVADTFVDDAKRRIGTSGYYLVLQAPGALTKASNEFEAQLRESVTDRIDEVVDHRADIEQAKGALRLVYRLTDSQAFDLLTWRSQETNVKIRDLARAICDELGSIEITPQTRSQFDHLLLNAHDNE
ncbi:ANTAR domain-containing protein [Gordonia sp. TBRC 11910]|uniref:ANTAR domain-containing protein n=1 Tax=Gordonia asplenii TaxID=2725283 RepID=A0A848L0X1_9ACTN|nr:PAS and ANTAR domain-containing protein [Gordonia asplenii]NMO04620.1 ANTAR domain-containing protein [Gordonia asplenii]